MGKTYYERPKRLDKLTREEKLDLMFDLIYSFKLVKEPLETALFLQDLLTANEIRNLAVRLRIAKLLLAGHTFGEIQEEIHVSSATITKVSVWLDQGGEGLRRVISKLPLRYEMPKKLPPGPIEYHLPQALLALAQYGLAKRREKQIKNVSEFLSSVERKKTLDKSLQEHFDEHYRKIKKKKGFFKS